MQTNIFSNKNNSIFHSCFLVLFSQAYIGLSYPFFDQKLGHCQSSDRDWTVIIRSFAIFIGLNHLVAKIYFDNSFHLLMILIVFNLVFWYWFDKTKFGFLFNILNALSVIVAAHVLRYFGIVQ